MSSATPVVKTIPEPTTSSQNGNASPDQSSSPRTEAGGDDHQHDDDGLHSDRGEDDVDGAAQRAKREIGSHQVPVAEQHAGERTPRHEGCGDERDNRCPTPPSAGPKAAADFAIAIAPNPIVMNPDNASRDVGHDDAEERVGKQRHRERDRPVQEIRL